MRIVATEAKRQIDLELSHFLKPNKDVRPKLKFYGRLKKQLLATHKKISSNNRTLMPPTFRQIEGESAKLECKQTFTNFYLNSGFRQVDLQRHFFPHKYVRVSGFAK